MMGLVSPKGHAVITREQSKDLVPMEMFAVFVC